MQIGKIRHVPLREIWHREDADFTVWLEDNIDYLFDQRESIESAFGGEVVWERLDPGKHTRIKDQFDGVDWTNQEDWPRIMEFLTDSATRLEHAFRDPIKQFKLTS
jgi:hypothetical protein